MKLQRELYQADPNKHRAMLSLYLNNYIASLNKYGQPSVAYTLEEEAVRLQRELFQVDPDEHRAKLAERLDNYAYPLLNADAFSNAHTVTEEAVQHWRELYATQPEEYEAKLITSLRLHAYWRLKGHHSEAMIIQEEISKLESGHYHLVTESSTSMSV